MKKGSGFGFVIPGGLPKLVYGTLQDLTKQLDCNQKQLIIAAILVTKALVDSGSIEAVKARIEAAKALDT